MTDETTNPAAGIDPAPIQTPAPAAAPAPNPAAAPDWRSGLPEDLRGAVEFNGLDGMESLARQFVAEKRATKGNFVPATDEQAADLFKKMGAPETLDGYADLGDVPEDKAEVKELEATLKKGALKAHLTPQQYEAMRDGLFEEWKGIYDKQSAAETAARDKAARDLKEEFGATLESRMTDFRYLTETAGLKEWAQNNGADKDPVFIKAILKFGEKYVEPTGAPIGPRNTGAANIEAEIRAMMAVPAYMDARHPQHNDVVNQVFNLRRRLNGEV